MVGLHILHNLKNTNASNDSFATLKLEDWHRKEALYDNGNLFVNVSYYNGYPIKWESYKNSLIIIEGMIYNHSTEEVINFCKLIQDENLEDSQIRDKIGAFVEHADGDFLISVLNFKTQQYIIFNDLFGRMHLYYHVADDMFVAGRTIPFILHNIPKIEIDKFALTEFLLIEFQLGNNTFFKNIKRLTPAEILIIKNNNQSLVLNQFKACEEDFTKENPYTDKKLALDNLYTTLMEATKNRIQKLQNEGYAIYNTLSGGFDSRAIFGAINNITGQFTNVTFEYIQDESTIAEKVTNSVCSESHYKKLSFHNYINYSDSELLYKTGGTVNIFTTSACYNDSLFMKKELLQNKDAIIGGFGGEFIRHPYHALPISPYNYLSYYCSSIPTQKILPIFDIKPKDFKKYWNNTLNLYKKDTQEDKYKRLYYEYYRNQVVCAGEDRTRMFAWTVQPMMSAPFLRIIRKKIHLKWANFQFFTDFMSLIDKRLLNVPIFGKNTNLRDTESIKELTPINQKVIKILMVIYFRKYILRFIEWRKRDKTNSITLEMIDSFYQKLDYYKPIINYPYINKEFGRWPISLKRGVLSLMMYLYELEKRYKPKLS